MAAAGRVCTGFLKPYVATYANSSSTVTYSGGMQLARGVKVSVTVETSEDNEFWADCEFQENDAGKFQKGKMSMEVDGLLPAAQKVIEGLPEAVPSGSPEINVVKHSAKLQRPYVGVGVIIRYMSGGVTSYVPTVFRKAMFSAPGTEAASQSGPQIDWQTQKLEATLYRDDTDDHAWKWEADAQATETEAETALKALLNIV